MSSNYYGFALLMTPGGFLREHGSLVGSYLILRRNCLLPQLTLLMKLGGFLRAASPPVTDEVVEDDVP